MEVKLSSHNPHFAQIGGAEGIDRLVEAFYRHVDALPLAAGIRAMHAADLEPTKAILKAYLTEWMGGPKQYTPRRGPPRLRRAHSAFAIGEAERDAWMQCMRGALEETVADANLREQLERAFFKLAETVRNDPGNPHDIDLSNRLRPARTAGPSS
ncbi:MAG TPA: group II truncated hemoglobin [Burkholderiaceae bacterium]|nr:group II truncated hemoglobin [Burkholderiaceae bacterium]